MKQFVYHPLFFIFVFTVLGWLAIGCTVTDSHPGDLAASELEDYTVLIQDTDGIHAWDAASGDLFLLTDEVTGFVPMRASQSGSYIAFSRRTEGEAPWFNHAELYLLNTHTGQEITLNTPPLSLSDIQMAWAPDETHLLITARFSEPDYEAVLMLVSVPDGEVTVLDTHSYPFTGPHWHPDSRRFTYMKYPSFQPFASAIGYMSSLTGQAVAVTQGRSMYSNLQFSPDGRFLAFQELADSVHYLSTLLVESLSYHQRVKMKAFDLPQTWGRPTIFGPHDASGFNLAWVPGSVNQLIFQNYKRGTNRPWYIYSSPADSKSPLIYETDVFLRTKPAFSPDGRFWISYQRMNVGEPVSQSAVVVRERISGKTLTIENAPANINSLQLVPRIGY